MTVVLLGATALAAACVQASTGLGFALVLTPVAFALLSPVSAIVLVTILGLLLNLLVLAGERRPLDIAWAEAVPILLAAVPGMACGVVALRLLAKPVLQTAVGVALIATVAIQLWLRRRAASPASRSATGGYGPRLALGLGTGALTTATGVSGPPLAIWLARRGFSPVQVRDSLSAMFLVIGLLACVALAPLLGRVHVTPGLIAVSTAGVLGGHALGRRVFARLPPHHFVAVLYLVILGAGVASIVSGTAGH